MFILLLKIFLPGREKENEEGNIKYRALLIFYMFAITHSFIPIE